MEDVANTETLPNRDRLTFITRNFSSLQGLSLVALGAFWCVLEIPTISGGYWPFPLQLLFLAAWVRLLLYIPKYYERRFGKVEQESNLSNKAALVWFLLFLGVLVFGRRIGVYLDALLDQLHLAISDPGKEVHSSPLLWWTLWFFSSFRWSIQRMDRTAMYFFFFGLLSWSLTIFYPLSDPGIRQSAVWKLLDTCSLGISLIALGLFNHFTLVRLLSKRTTGDANE